MTRRTRRSMLAAVGASVALAGCQGVLPGETEEEDTTDGGTDTASPTRTATETSRPDEGPGTLITDFESLEAWGALPGHGSLSVATDTAFRGSQSARLTAENPVDFAGAYGAFQEPQNFEGQTFSAAVNAARPGLVGVTLVLVAPDRDNLLMHDRLLLGPTDSWVRIDFGPTSAESLPDLTQVREVQLRVRRLQGEGPVDVRFDDLRVRPRPDTGAVVLTFDGMRESQYEIGFDVMEEFGYSGVMSAMPRALGNIDRLELPQLYDLRDAGWDVVSRPTTQGEFWPDLATTKQRSLVTTTKNFLVNKGFEDGARTFVANKGVVGPETVEIVAEHHEQMFRQGGGPNGLPLTDPHNVGRVGAADDAATRAAIDLAATYPSVAVLQFDGFGNGGMDPEGLRRLLAYVEDAEVEVLTASELLGRA